MSSEDLLSSDTVSPSPSPSPSQTNKRRLQSTNTLSSNQSPKKKRKLNNPMEKIRQCFTENTTLKKENSALKKQNQYLTNFMNQIITESNNYNTNENQYNNNNNTNNNNNLSDTINVDAFQKPPSQSNCTNNQDTSDNSNSRKRKFNEIHDLNNNDNSSKKQRITENTNEYHFNNKENNSNISNINNDSIHSNDNNPDNYNFEDEYFDKEFDDNNNYNWSDDNDNDNNLTSLNRTPSVQYWLCNQCNQLNNLKDTFSKYDMKCFQCDCDYSVKSKVIQLNEDPIQESVWKCPQCTFCNQSDVNQCKMCQYEKQREEKHIPKTKEIASFSNEYSDNYSNALIKQYIKKIVNNKSWNLCPNNSTIPHILSLIILKYYQLNVCHFWNVDHLFNNRNTGFLYSDSAENKTMLMLKDRFSQAFSLQKTKQLAHYSWTIQIHNRNRNNNSLRIGAIDFWIGVIESKHEKTHELRSNSEKTDLFCNKSFGFGVCGFNGYKRNGYKRNGYKRYKQERFCDPFKINDVITVKLKCTRGYYELLYFVNGESVGQPKVAYRLPNDKMYEMVIGLSGESVKIKCIQFMTKTYVPL